MSDRTEKLLEELAAKLGVTVQHLWEVLIRGNKTEGYILLAYIVFGMIAATCGAWSIRWAMKNPDNRYEEAFGMSGVIALLLGIAITVSLSYWCVMDLVMPEYGALYEILQHLGK